MVQSFKKADKDAAHVLYDNITTQGLESNVRWGCVVTAGTDAMGVDIETGGVSVANEKIYMDSVTNYGVQASNSDPRWDVIYVNANGSYDDASGTAEPAQAPDGVSASGTKAYRPAPPSMQNIEGAVLAAIWVPGNATEITDDNIYDLRYVSDARFHRLRTTYFNTETIGGPLTNGVDVTSLAGQGLTINNNQLQVTDAVLDGSGSTSSSDLERVNAVTDLGADPNGGSDVGQIIQDNQAAGREIFFPEGRYMVASTPSIRDSACVVTEGGAVVENRFAITGPNAEFFPVDATTFQDATGNGYPDSSFLRGNIDNQHLRLILDGITWDLTDTHAGHGLVAAPVGSLLVNNIRIAGEWTREDHTRNVFNLDVRDATHLTLFNNLRAMDGSIHQPTTDGYGADQGGNEYHEQPAAIYCDQSCNPDATIRVQNSAIQGWPNNGIYGSATAAAVQIENCLFKNNGHANVRLGGNRSYVKGTRILVDSDVDSTLETCRGIWLREESDSDDTDPVDAPASEEETAARVEGCFIEVENISGPTPKAIHVDATLGSATIEDTVIISSLNAGTPAVDIEAYATTGGGDELPEDHTSVAFRNCYIRRNSQGAGSDGVYTGRNRVVFEDCTFRAVNSADTSLTLNSNAAHNRVEYSFFYGSGSDIQWDGADGILTHSQDDQGGESPQVSGSSPRLLINDESDNNGQDPRNGGPWNGHGRYGIVVTWTNNGTRYYARYSGSSWHAWSATA